MEKRMLSANHREYPGHPLLVTDSDLVTDTRIYTFGRFRIEQAGETLGFSKKSHNMPLQLLKLILSSSRQGVCMRRIIDGLWPQVEGDAGYSNLTITLHRLRKIIGKDIVVTSDGYLYLDLNKCWVDCWALDDLLDQADMTREYGLIQRCYQQIFVLGQGLFLESEEGLPWVIAQQEYYRQKLQRVTLKLAGNLYHAGRYHDAIDCYLRGLEIDCLVESFYIGLMQCYFVLGRKAEAISTYWRCSRMFKHQLGVDPGPDMTQIYNSVLMDS